MVSVAVTRCCVKSGLMLQGLLVLGTLVGSDRKGHGLPEPTLCLGGQSGGLGLPLGLPLGICACLGPMYQASKQGLGAWFPDGGPRAISLEVCEIAVNRDQLLHLLTGNSAEPAAGQ